MKKLNIALFADTFFPMIDGTVNVLDNVAKLLCKNHNVTVFAPRGKTDFDDTIFPYKVVRCKSHKVPTTDYLHAKPSKDKNFQKALDEGLFDIVHIHAPFNIGKAGVKYAKARNIPAVASLHSQYKKDFKRSVKLEFLTNMLLKKIMKVFDSCDQVWPVNKAMVGVYESYHGKAPTEYLDNATDFSFVTDEKPIADLRKELKISPDEKVFLFVGRINILKNILFTCDVLKCLQNKGFKFKMLFIGVGPDENKLKSKINSLNINAECIMLGKISDRQKIAQYYRLADLFIFPSKYDASSLVQIEAASQKTPTIFIKDTITSGTITENVNGYMSDDNPEIFANKIIDIFKDEKAYNIICENAYRDLYKNWEDYVNIVEQRYLNLIKNKV